MTPPGHISSPEVPGCELQIPDPDTETPNGVVGAPHLDPSIRMQVIWGIYLIWTPPKGHIRAPQDPIPRSPDVISAYHRYYTARDIYISDGPVGLGEVVRSGCRGPMPR